MPQNPFREGAMASVHVRPYSPADESQVVAVWNAAMHCDPITPEGFRIQVLLDPNLDAQGFLVAEDAGKVVGYLLSLVRRVPLLGGDLETERAWITAFGVHPQRQREGIGSRLLTAALDHLRSLGREVVLVSPYTPHYFIPGVDVNAYAAAVAFLEHHGFQVTSRPLSMQANLTTFQVPPEVAEREKQLAERGITVRPMQPEDILPLLSFLRENFGWDWYRFYQESLLEINTQGGQNRISIFVALHEGCVIGCSHHRLERFGPFGVQEAWRGQGIGSILLARCLREMRAKGYHCAWFLWTDDRAARLYRRFGFQEVRRFAILKREIG